MHAVPKRTVHHSFFQRSTSSLLNSRYTRRVDGGAPQQAAEAADFLTFFASSGDDGREPMCQLLDALTRDEAHNLLNVRWRCVACVSPYLVYAYVGSLADDPTKTQPISFVVSNADSRSSVPVGED